MSIIGIDVSHWQNLEFTRKKITELGAQFVMIKATEGKNYVDEKMKMYADYCIEQGIPFGFYHYARPEINTMREEAEHFVSTIRDYIGICTMALDWEQNALAFDTNVPRRWLETVYGLTNIKPMFYVSYAYAKKYEDLADDNIGLWMARYNKEMLKDGENIGKWKQPAMWQYDSKDIDKNKFFGTVEQFRKYMRPAYMDNNEQEEKNLLECGNKKEYCPLWRMLNGMV